jgi:hypothetical protein
MLLSVLQTLFEFLDSPSQVGGLDRPPGALQQLRHGTGFRGCQISAGKSLHHPDEACGDVARRLCFLCVIGSSLLACIVYSLSLMPGNSSGGLSLAASPAKTGAQQAKVDKSIEITIPYL